MTSSNDVKEPQQTYGEPANAGPDADAAAQAEAEVEATLKGSMQRCGARRKQPGTDLIIMRNGVITRVSPVEKSAP